MTIDFTPLDQQQPQNNGIDFTPSESATLLGHATAQSQQFFQSPLQNIATGQSQPTQSSPFQNELSRQDPTGQQAKSLATGILPMAGAVGGGALGAIAGGVAASPTILGIPAGVIAGGAAGAGLGSATGEAAKEKLQGQSLSPADIASTGLQYGALEAVGGPAAKLVGKAGGLLGKPLADMTGLTKFLSDRAASKATRALESTAETMTKAEREQAILDGRLQPTLTGGGKYVPSDTEKRAGEILSGQMSKSPVKNVGPVQDAIASRGAEAEQFLQTNAKPITNEEDFNAFQDQRAKTSTYLTPTATKAYDEMLGVFQGILKKYAEKEGGYNTSNYYQALKEFESNVTQNLPKGKEALLDEGGSARLQAAKDVRKVVRDMIGSKNPEFKGKMFDLASLYDARDNVVTKAEQYVRDHGASGIKGRIAQFATEHPFITGGTALAGYETLKDEIKKATGL